MGVLKAGLLAAVVIGVKGSPVEDTNAWQNTSTINTTTSTSEDGRVTIFAPVTQVTQLSLSMPDTTPPIAASPVTQVTQLSLEGPVSGGTGSAWETTRTSIPIAFSPVTQITQVSLNAPDNGSTGPSTTRTSIPIAFSPVTQITQVSLDAPDTGATGTAKETTTRGSGGLRPIVQPTDTVLVVPVPNGDSSTTHITVEATARVEQSASALAPPDMGTFSPKMPHIENTGIALVIPTGAGETEGAVTIALPTPHSNGGSQSAQQDDNPSKGAADAQGSNGGASPTQQGGQDSQQTVKPPNGEHNGSLQTFFAAGTPVVAGGPPVTVGDNTYSLAPSGSLMLNGATIPVTTTDDHVVLATNAGGATYDSSAVSQLLGSLSVPPAGRSEEQTTGDATASPTGSRSGGSGRITTTSGSARETSTSASGDESDNDNEGTEPSSGTSTSDSSPATQSDSAGAALSALAYPVTALVAVIGLLAVVI